MEDKKYKFLKFTDLKTIGKFGTWDASFYIRLENEIKSIMNLTDSQISNLLDIIKTDITISQLNSLKQHISNNNSIITTLMYFIASKKDLTKLNIEEKRQLVAIGLYSLVKINSIGKGAININDTIYKIEKSCNLKFEDLGIVSFGKNESAYESFLNKYLFNEFKELPELKEANIPLYIKTVDYLPLKAEYLEMFSGSMGFCSFNIHAKEELFFACIINIKLNTLKDLYSHLPIPGIERQIFNSFSEAEYFIKNELFEKISKLDESFFIKHLNLTFSGLGDKLGCSFEDYEDTEFNSLTALWNINKYNDFLGQINELFRTKN